MTLITEYCAQRNKILVLDTTFRLYAINRFDERAQLEQSNCRYFIIEDTGKTWPTHDLKASLISYSSKCAKRFETIYDEVYLCHSRFAMLMFETIFERSQNTGIATCIHEPMNTRHSYLIEQLSGTIAQPRTDRACATLPMEWFELKINCLMSDIYAVNYLAEKDVHVLPGNYFYWKKIKPPHATFRVSLARPLSKFHASVDKLKIAITQFEEEHTREASNVLA
ncbi:enduracididine biosynthesis enzyme MppP [compost metagenome]